MKDKLSWSMWTKCRMWNILCCKSLLGGNEDYSWEVIETSNPGMMKCVVGIGLEENSSHKCVAMIRFILSAFYLD